VIGKFLDKNGRPRPVKTEIQKDIQKMYDDKFKPDPLGPPVPDREGKDIPFYKEMDFN
jgi:hypothetical protein